jgi:hypothetical protein
MARNGRKIASRKPMPEAGGSSATRWATSTVNGLSAATP